MKKRQLEKMARNIRQSIIEMIWSSNGGHVGGSLSCADILTVLYFQILRIDPHNPSWEQRDRFILSKGHAAACLYAILAEKGYFPKEALFNSFIQVKGFLQEHPDMKKTPGVDMTSGSLGQGLSAASGMAWGLKRKGSDSRVYVLLGDGELNEGQNWEAAMAASHFKFANLTAIVDYNKLGVNGSIAEMMSIEPLREKWQAFGWIAREIDGHNLAQISEALEWAKSNTPDKPKVIIAHTIKGKGVSFMENDFHFHACSLTKEQYEEALQELS